MFLGGEAGAGKSSVALEFARRVGRRARFLVGICDGGATPRALGPLFDVAEALGVRAELDQSSVRRASLFPLVRTALGRSPTLLLLEDVHGADEATLDLIRYAAARTLRSRRTGQIAFAMPDVGNPVYASMVESIQEVARAHGLRLMLHSTGADAEDELAMIRDLKHRYVDGLILASLHLTEAHADELRRAAAPVIVIGSPTKGTAADSVRPYSRKGAAEAVRHLYEVGRRRIALVNGPQHTAPGASRRLGYFDGLRSCGVARDDARCEVADDFMIEPGRRATKRLLQRTNSRRGLLRQRPARHRRSLGAARGGARRARRRGARRDGQHGLGRGHVADAHLGRPARS